MTPHMDGSPAGRGRYAHARRLIAEESSSGLDGVVGSLQRLCRALTTNLDVMGVAVSLMSQAGSEGVAAGSDARCRDVDELQFTTGEGPCRDAFAARRPVLTPDLRSMGSTRWPGFTSAAVEAGVGGVFAFPLHVGAVGFGVLDVYTSRPGSLTEDQLAVALTFARIATEMLLDADLTTPGGDLDPGLGAALDYRAEIHQAQGMVMVALQVTLAEALARMRARAFASDQPLIELALEILAGHMSLEGEF